MVFNQLNIGKCRFDTKTVWPPAITKQYDIPFILEQGKNPGLGIKKLHKKGITGKGVNVGIIDTKLFSMHNEYHDRLKLYEEAIPIEGPPHYHGTSILSILAGKNTGVAPEADIYYIGYDPDSTAVPYVDQLAKGLERLLEINRELPEKEKLRVISVSSGWSDVNAKKAESLYYAIAAAKKEGIFVLTARAYETDQVYFDGLDRAFLGDPDDIGSYIPVITSSLEPNAKALLIPMYGRTMASPTDADDYVYYGDGGWSMVVPYISGLYTLACQVKPEITPDEFWKIALETGTPLDQQKYGQEFDGYVIVNPVKLFNSLLS
jgi:hypothetical protein